MRIEYMKKVRVGLRLLLTSHRIDPALNIYLFVYRTHGDVPYVANNSLISQDKERLKI